ncbi:hypothetical protein MHU86_21430 [Fragilaria crotonensis]|nr:hypothetical protein MHU86_21430 [Fragilaria crotonensis]
MHYPTGQQSLYNNNSNNVVNDPVANTTTTTGNNNSNLSEKKLRRLEKNRLSARECRRRKREATEDMEQEIFRLEAENLKLRLQLRIGEEAEESICREQDRVTEEIEHLLKSGASEGEIYATIEDFKEKFADYGRDRRSAIEFHLHNVERLLQPTQTTSVAMRALEGGTKLMESGGMMPSTADGSQPTFTASTAIAGMGDATQSESTNEGASLLEPKTLFSYLVNYLQVTPEQAAALKDSRWVARELDECLHSSLDVLEELRQRLRLCGNGLETEFENVRSVLTPTQAAKFLVWVANNRACIHMLNELWSRVYPDPSADDFEEEDRKPEAKDTIPESSQAPY